MPSEKWHRKDKLTILQICLTVLSVGFSAFFIYMQLKQGNEIAWRNALETKSTELFKLEIQDAVLTCIYKYEMKTIDDKCTAILKKPENFMKAYAYIEEVLLFMGEIRDYSQEFDKKYVRNYDDWIEEFSKSDITQYYLFKEKTDEKKALEFYNIKTNDVDIRKGYSAFKKRMNLKD
jgi:hypothetical protein